MKLISKGEALERLQINMGFNRFSLGEGEDIEGSDKKQLYIYLRYRRDTAFVRNLFNNYLNINVVYMGEIKAS